MVALLVVAIADDADAWQAYIDADQDGDVTTVGDVVTGMESVVGDLVLVIEPQDIGTMPQEISMELEWDCVEQPENPYLCLENHGTVDPFEWLSHPASLPGTEVVASQCLLVHCGCNYSLLIAVTIYNDGLVPGAYPIWQAEFSRHGLDCGSPDTIYDSVPWTYSQTEFRLWKDIWPREFLASLTMFTDAVPVGSTTWSSLKAMYLVD